jgi:hypothetical protein
VLPKRLHVQKAVYTVGMAFSLASLGPFLAFHVLFLLPIPRVAGSMRTTRLLASNIHPASESEYTSIENTSFNVLATSSPGFFLDLDVPSKPSCPCVPVTPELEKESTFLLKVYGHKCAGASLYGICVDCSHNGDYGRYWTVDGHNASISTSFESTPVILTVLVLPKELIFFRAVCFPWL